MFVFLTSSCYNIFITKQFPDHSKMTRSASYNNASPFVRIIRRFLMSLIPWNIYPRPQLQRDSFLCLNGEWEFHDATSLIFNGSATSSAVSSGTAYSVSTTMLPSVPDKFTSIIQVPFPPQSALGGVTTGAHTSSSCEPTAKTVSGTDFELVFYRRTVRIPDEFTGKRVLLHFGAVDQIADVYWNGIPVATHEGGYLPFTVELTEYLDPAITENELVLRVKDTLDHTYPYGKQRKDRGGMWYTPVSGIWQTVWMEALPDTFIKSLKITPQLNSVNIEIDVERPLAQSACSLPAFEVQVLEAQIFEAQTFEVQTYDNAVDKPDVPHATKHTLNGTSDESAYATESFCTIEFSGALEHSDTIKCACNITHDGNCYTITPANPKHWTPETPYIYEFTVTVGKDTVRSYFALRTLETKTVNGIPRLCLNGKPYFFHGLLDQGYFHDGIFLPETPQGYTKDILTMKQLGFNMFRKHIKIEPEYFYTACDYLGMVVFQDFVNNSDYSFVRDTALPTVGLQKLPNAFLRRSEAAKEFFITHSHETVEHLYNHPSICQWTVFNEGWGQFDADRLYELVKQWDTTRFTDTTSGWFRETKSDVESRHVYFKKVKPVKSDKPFFLSEFGGYCYAVEGHLYDPDKSYGYRNCKTQEAFMDALETLYLEQIAPLVKEGLCATVYTQVSDVEEEINGLFTYDREVLKVNIERMAAIAKQLFESLNT